MKLKNWHVSTDYDSWCQEHLLKTEIDLTAPWNEGSRPPIEDWLAHSQSPEDRERLTCMGNIVVPLQAKHALSLLSEIQAEIQAWNRPPICWQWLLCWVEKARAWSIQQGTQVSLWWLCSCCKCQSFPISVIIIIIITMMWSVLFGFGVMVDFRNSRVGIYLSLHNLQGDSDFKPFLFERCTWSRFIIHR